MKLSKGYKGLQEVSVMAQGYIAKLNRRNVMQTKEITENLLAAGCGEMEIDMIVSSIQTGDRKIQKS